MRRVTKRLEALDEYFLFLAHVVAIRATCSRRRVGCLLVNTEKHIKATGYNGLPSGMPHCFEAPCLGAEAPSGTMLEHCHAIHAEVNALAQLDNKIAPLTAYITVTPCLACAKSIVDNKMIKTVVTSAIYDDSMGLLYLKEHGLSHRTVEIDGDQIIKEFLGGIK